MGISFASFSRVVLLMESFTVEAFFKAAGALKITLGFGAWKVGQWIGARNIAGIKLIQEGEYTMSKTRVAFITISIWVHY